MSKFLSLIKVQMLSFLGLNKVFYGKKKKQTKKLTSIGFGALVVLALFVSFVYIYVKSFIEILPSIEQLISYVFCLIFCVVLFLSFYTTASLIYGFKDYEMLSAMPLKTWHIVFSKLLASIIVSIAISFVVVITALYVYATNGGNLTLHYVISCIGLTIFSPLLPLSISIIIGVAFLIFSSLFKHKNLVQILLYVGVLVAYMICSFIYSSDLLNSFVLIEKIYFLMPITEKAFNNVGYLFLFIAINFLIFTAIFAFVVLTYGKVRNLLTARKTSRTYKHKQYKSKSKFSALYRKEFKRLFSCPTYVLNGLIGYFLAIILSIVFIVFSSAVSDKTGQNMGNSFAIYVVLLMSFCLLLTPTTNCSISLEGNNLWILRTLPIDFKQLFNAKILTNLTFAIPSSLIVSLVCAIGMKMSISYAIVIVLTSIFIAVAGASFGLLANILLPKLNWENETQAVKQGLSTLLTVAFAFLCCGIIIMFGVLHVNISSIWFLVGYMFYLVLISSVSYYLIIFKGEKILSRKEKQ